MRKLHEYLCRCPLREKYLQVGDKRLTTVRCNRPTF